MSKLICKVCGNDKFQILSENEALCKCGLRLTNFGDYHSEEPKIEKKPYELDHKRQASVITKVSLLKRAIDESLDKRDKEAFYKLTSKLRVYQQYLQTKEVNDLLVTSKEGLKESQEKT
jgi:IDEAL domain